MRLIAAVSIVIAVSGCGHLPSRAPASKRCVQDIADEVRAGNANVPRFIFHFGRKTLLDQDVLSRGVPEAVWWSVIFGEDDRWKLPRFRRGLYGTERALRADRFANRSDPAMIRVEIRPECRAPSRVATTLKINDEPRFKKWKERYPEWDDLGCVEANGSLAVRLYARFDTTAPSDRTLRCEALIDRYFEDTDVRVVQDEAVDASWYIRKPGCIATIEGTDSELIGMFGEAEFFGADRCGENTDSLSSSRIFMRLILRSNPEPSNERYLKAVSAWSDARLSIPPSPSWIADFASAYGRCRGTRRLDELRSAYSEFDALLSDVENYEYWVKIYGEPPSPFHSVCR